MSEIVPGDVAARAASSLADLAERVDRLEAEARRAALAGRRGRQRDLVSAWMCADDIERAAFRRFLSEADRFTSFVDSLR